MNVIINGIKVDSLYVYTRSHKDCEGCKHRDDSSLNFVKCKHFDRYVNATNKEDALCTFKKPITKSKEV